MRNSVILCVILFVALPVHGQPHNNQPYLLRKHIVKDSTWIAEPSKCNYVGEAGLKDGAYGWVQFEDIVRRKYDLLYFDANTFGSLQLILELPIGTKAIRLDTLSINAFKLINHHYGSLRRDFEERLHTIDVLTGLLTLVPTSDHGVVIDGRIFIDTENPATHQEIVFDHCAMKVKTVAELQEIDRVEKLEQEKQDKIRWESFALVSGERKKFYDSVSNMVKSPRNTIRCSLNKRTSFEFTLDKSYVLLDAVMSNGTKGDAGELLGGNILAPTAGKGTVLTFHSFHDPIKSSIDDETNYSLTIEIDSLMTGRSYTLGNDQKDFIAKLSFWHYGPMGRAVVLKEASGFITIIEDRQKSTRGAIDLKFTDAYSHNSIIILKGDFELPKVRLSDIEKMEARVSKKLKERFPEIDK